VPIGAIKAPFPSPIFICWSQIEVFAMMETENVLGEEYPQKLKYPEVMTRAFVIHKQKVEEGQHVSYHPALMNPVRGTPGSCECYLEAWIELIGVPREMLHWDPNEAPFEPRQ
jgi:hypothetical protein